MSLGTICMILLKQLLNLNRLLFNPNQEEGSHELFESTKMNLRTKRWDSGRELTGYFK